MPGQIVIRGLRKQFPKVLAVAGVDLDVAAGEVFGLLGPNGAGKTTTLEMIEGLTPADAGEIEICGLNWREHAQQIRARGVEELTIDDCRLTGEPNLQSSIINLRPRDPRLMGVLLLVAVDFMRIGTLEFLDLFLERFLFLARHAVVGSPGPLLFAGWIGHREFLSP